MSNVENKINLWKEVWRSLINDFLKNSYGLSIHSPHTLIEDIIIEIDDNEFKSRENKRYFQVKINEYLENDSVIKNHFKSEFSLLKKKFNSENTEYIRALCVNIEKSFKNGIYFSETLNNLESILLSESKLEAEEILLLDYYSQKLIIELIIKSYDLEDIKNFLDNIFYTYTYPNREDVLETRYPHNFDYKKFKDIKGDVNYKLASESLQSFLDNLTIKERINKLSYYFNKKAEKVKYVFFVKGVKGTIETKIGDVTFYNVDNKQFVSNEKQKSGEDLQTGLVDKKYLQVAVEVDYLLPKSSFKIALSKVRDTIDLLFCYAENLKAEIKLNQSTYIIVNNEESVIHRSFGDKRIDGEYRYEDALDFDSHSEGINKLTKHSFLWDKTEKSMTVSKIKRAIHWISKGDQSLNDIDKLLNYWIAIECLIASDKNINDSILNKKNNSDFYLVQEIISSNQVSNYIYAYGWEIFKYFRNKVDSIFNPTNIPNELIEEAMLDVEVGKIVYLENFIKALPKLREYEDNLFFLDKIDSVIKFYSDSNFRTKQIENQIRQVKNDILLIYRYRNLTVHNAHFNNSRLPYFSWKSKFYSKSLLREVISKYEQNAKLSDIIYGIHIKKEKLILELDDKNFNLFNRPYNYKDKKQ